MLHKKLCCVREQEDAMAQVNLKSLGVHVWGKKQCLLLSIPLSMEACWHFQSSLEAECRVESHGGRSTAWSAGTGPVGPMGSLCEPQQPGHCWQGWILLWNNVCWVLMVFLEKMDSYWTQHPGRHKDALWSHILCGSSDISHVDTAFSPRYLPLNVCSFPVVH